MTLSRQQRAAGVPERYAEAKWDDAIEQPAGWDFPRFRDHCLERKVVGITTQNAAHAAAICDWSDGDPWLYVEGPVGTGKTLLCAALVNRLCGGDRLVWKARPGVVSQGGGHTHAAGHYVRASAASVVMVTEREVHRRSDVVHRKDDPAPLHQLMTASLVILDDLGTSRPKSEKDNQRIVDNIENLVTHRYDKCRPMIITSNVQMSALRGKYGPRTSRRLKQMCQIHRLAKEVWSDA